MNYSTHYEDYEEGNTKPSGLGKKNDGILNQIAETLEANKARNAAEFLQQIPNIIICRKYATDKENDLEIFENTLPEAIQKITYLHDSSEVMKNIKDGEKNLVFLGQHFDHGRSGTQLASIIKNSGKDAEVILITSINLHSTDLIHVDKYYKISQSQGKSDGSEWIMSHVVNALPKGLVSIPMFKGLIGDKAKLEFALEVLHSFMDKDTAIAVFKEGREGNVFNKDIMKELEDEFLTIVPLDMFGQNAEEKSNKFSGFRDKILALAGLNN